ncbi:MAG: M13 family metallopeptidase [Bryobacteraceae bacterium]|jgi:endothelin-converting enzyme/putative endopeptidase
MYTFRCLLAAAFAAACLPAADGPSASGVDLKAMDPAVNPCQNFYQYACGGWRKNNPIPPDQSRWARFNELAERNLAIERGILEKAGSSQIGEFYAACMDEPAIEHKGVQPIEALLKQIDALTSRPELAGEIVRLHQSAVRALFSFRVSPDDKKSDQEIAHVSQGGLGLPDRDYYLKTDARSVELRKQYEEHIQAMFTLLAKAEGASGADPAAETHAVMKIETALAEASLDRVARRDPDKTYHKMSVDALALLTPDFEWKQYVSTIGIPPVESLDVEWPDFVKGLDAIIADNSMADLKTYLKWQVLTAHADMLPRAFDDEDFRFNEHILRGAQEMPPRWKRCVRATDRGLGEELGQEFVKVAFNGASKEKALQLVGEIEGEMRKDIEHAAWMTPATKDQALSKLQEVANKIGYPEKWRDYSSIKVRPDDYFGNVLRAYAFELHRNFAKIGKPVDKSEWGMTPPTVNAYYSPNMNNINFPAGILQPPFYNPKASDAVNYGGIGAVIGHELTHGFDDQGRKYDGAGNLRDWWTADDAKAFESRADCIAKEYDGFSPAPGANVNGKLTLGENAADNGGVHLAYMALMDSLANHMAGKQDGFTPQQQFFLGFGQVWCENDTEQAVRMQVATNPHSPGEFRANGVVRNMPEFQEAFSCKVGDPMISPDPCRVW